MAAHDGFNVVIQRDIASVWTTIAQLRDVSGPSMTKSTIDVTNKSSTARWREFLSGLRDGGEVTFEIEYDHDAATHAQLETDFAADVSASYRVNFGDTGATMASFSGICTGFQPLGPMEGALTANVTLKVTGAVTIA